MPELTSFLATSQGKVIATVAALVVIGSAVWVVLALSGGSGDPPAQVSVQMMTATLSPLTPSPTASPTPSPSPTPEPTPPPYDGAIARVSVPRLGINHYVEPVSVINNEMQAPNDGVYAIGWYPDYAKPGFGENSVFSAHETWNRARGPFYSLYLAVAGDQIIVTMDNGIEYRYEVMTNIRYAADTIPMGEVIWPSQRPEGEEWITLITCGGRILYNSTGYGDYLDRDVVQARRIESAAAITNAASPARAATR